MMKGGMTRGIMIRGGMIRDSARLWGRVKVRNMDLIRGISVRVRVTIIIRVSYRVSVRVPAGVRF